jgi:hypothetical protein
LRDTQRNEKQPPGFTRHEPGVRRHKHHEQNRVENAGRIVVQSIGIKYRVQSKYMDLKNFTTMVKKTGRVRNGE